MGRLYRLQRQGRNNQQAADEYVIPIRIFEANGVAISGLIATDFDSRIYNDYVRFPSHAWNLFEQKVL